MNNEADNETFDAGKLFDPKEFISIFVNTEGFTTREKNIAEMLDRLVGGEPSRKEAEEIFESLKRAGARDMLLTAVHTTGSTYKKARLLAACWESGLDFSDEVELFARCACDPDFTVAMEALTVIEHCMDGKIEKEKLDAALSYANECKQDNGLKADLIAALRQKIS
jgi:hypothetical protein